MVELHHGGDVFVDSVIRPIALNEQASLRLAGGMDEVKGKHGAKHRSSRTESLSDYGLVG
jgi:hypothetical protein